jgi:hypothetical protein
MASFGAVAARASLMSVRDMAFYFARNEAAGAARGKPGIGRGSGWMV